MFDILSQIFENLPHVTLLQYSLIAIAIWGIIHLIIGFIRR